jgi:hypothetical protein
MSSTPKEKVDVSAGPIDPHLPPNESMSKISENNRYFLV